VALVHLLVEHVGSLSKRKQKSWFQEKFKKHFNQNKIEFRNSLLVSRKIQETFQSK